MAAGYQATVDSLNQTAFRVFFNLGNAFQDVHDFYSWLAIMADADLITIGFTQAEVTALRAAYDDLFVLWEIEQGVTLTDPRQGTVYDFRTLTTPLLGGQIRT